MASAVLVFLTTNWPTANILGRHTPYLGGRHTTEKLVLRQETAGRRRIALLLLCLLVVVVAAMVAAMVVVDRSGGSSRLNAKARFRCNKFNTGPTVARGLLSLS